MFEIGNYFFRLIESSQEPVVRRGEELLKKKAFAANLDDQKLINKLFLLFNGMNAELYC